MEHVNLKAGILAIILLVFTYGYYVQRPGSIFSLSTALTLGALATGIFFAYFFGVKIISHAISGKIYPNILLNILLPLIVIGFFAWLLFAFIYIKPFGRTGDFADTLKYFFFRHGLFIALSTLAVGLTLSFPLQKERVADAGLLRSNLIFLSCAVVAFVLSIYAFYYAKRIRQPQLNAKFEQYKSLKDITGSAHCDVMLLVRAREFNYVGRPYLVPYKNELIIAAEYNSTGREKPVETIYRISKDGDIIDQISEDELRANDFFPIVLKEGMLTDGNGKEWITWIFDGNKARQNRAQLVLKEEWKLEALQERSGQLTTVYFNKTGAFHCNNLKGIQYNGTKYFDLLHAGDMVKIKIDSVFTHIDNAGNCAEKKLEYYYSDQLNFGLLRLNEQAYYIIKPKKK
jgi:hypothetical protein